MKPGNNAFDEERRQITNEKLNNLIEWPFPKIALKRDNSRKQTHARGYRYADINCCKSATSYWPIYDKNGHVTENKFGIMLNVYNSIEELLDDGWRLD